MSNDFALPDEDSQKLQADEKEREQQLEHKKALLAEDLADFNRMMFQRYKQPKGGKSEQE